MNERYHHAQSEKIAEEIQHIFDAFARKSICCAGIFFNVILGPLESRSGRIDNISEYFIK